MAANLNTGLNSGLNPGLRQSISGGVDSLGLFRLASLDLRFADKKTLADRVSGNNLITFSRASAGTYVDSDGLIKTAAIDVARFDHGPVTGESLGLLIEENRTNQLLRNVTFSDSLWTKSNISVLDDQIVAPNGAAEADKLTATNTANEARHIRQDSTIITGKTYTQSVFAKAGEVTVLQIAPSSKFTNDFQNFDLSTGQLGSGGSGTATIEAYPNGWYRCSLTRDSIGGTGQGRMLFALVESATSTRVESFQADAGDGLYIWGAQLEASTFPSSFIATAASTVTRSPDIASIEGTDFSSWYNQSEGTIFANSSGKLGKIVVISDGTDSNKHELSSTSTDVTLSQENSGSSQVSLSQSLSSKSAFAYATNDYGLSVGGAAAITDTSATPPTVNKMSIGCQYDDSLQLNGHIKRLAYFSTRRTDAELVKMTS